MAKEWRSTQAITGPNSFLIEMVGDAMINPVGNPSISPGALLTIDPDLSPTNGSIVFCELSGQPTVKTLVHDGGKQYLSSLNPKYPIIELPAKTTIVGVAVSSTIFF